MSTIFDQPMAEANLMTASFAIDYSLSRSSSRVRISCLTLHSQHLSHSFLMSKYKHCTCQQATTVQTLLQFGCVRS